MLYYGFCVYAYLNLYRRTRATIKKNAKAQFDKQHVQKTFQPGDTVFVETTQRNQMHKKFAAGHAV